MKLLRKTRAVVNWRAAAYGGLKKLWNWLTGNKTDVNTKNDDCGAKTNTEISVDTELSLEFGAEELIDFMKAYPEYDGNLQELANKTLAKVGVVMDRAIHNSNVVTQQILETVHNGIMQAERNRHEEAELQREHRYAERKADFAARKEVEAYERNFDKKEKKD